MNDKDAKTNNRKAICKPKALDKYPIKGGPKKNPTIP